MLSANQGDRERHLVFEGIRCSVWKGIDVYIRRIEEGREM